MSGDWFRRGSDHHGGDLLAVRGHEVGEVLLAHRQYADIFRGTRGHAGEGRGGQVLAALPRTRAEEGGVGMTVVGAL